VNVQKILKLIETLVAISFLLTVFLSFFLTVFLSFFLV